MATLVKTPSGKWKAIIRRAGWPLTVKTFRTQRDAGDWARRTEDDMVRGAFIQRATGDRMTVAAAMKRYLADVVPSKRPTTQAADLRRSKIIVKHLGRYSLTSLTPEVIAQFRDMRLAGEDRKDAAGNAMPRTNSTVRLDLALLGHLLTIAIKEWGVNLPANPVTNIRRPASGPGRNRRLSQEEESRLLAAVDQHSNPMMGWIVRIALETGMRWSEILTLRESQVDLKRRIVRLLKTKNTQPRTVPLTLSAVEMFRKAIANPVRPDDTDLIFSGAPGRDGVRSPSCFVHSIPAWNDRLREDEQRVGMGERDLLDRPLLKLQPRVKTAVSLLSAQVGVDGENMGIGNRAMESSVGCDGCRKENGKGHGCAETSIRRYQYDDQPQTKPAGSGKPVASCDQRMGDGYKTQRGERQSSERSHCRDREVTAAIEGDPGRSCECYQSSPDREGYSEVVARPKEALRAGNHAPGGGCVIEDCTERVQAPL